MQHSFRFLSLLAFLLAFTACEKEAFTPAPAEPVAAKADLLGKAHKTKTSYRASLGSLNDSGVSGTAMLTLEDGMLTVTIEASGLVADVPHAQHIHGHTDSPRAAVCPPPAADTNGDGMISVPEGVPFYGAILLPLTPFPVADADGNISYTNTFPYTGDLGQLQKRVIVLHGGNFMGDYIASLPVACGKITVSK